MDPSVENYNCFEKLLSVFHKHVPSAVRDDSIRNSYKYNYTCAYFAANHYFVFFEDFDDVDDCYVSVKDLTSGQKLKTFESVSEFETFLDQFQKFPP
jgi:hypothetical protein